MSVRTQSENPRGRPPKFPFDEYGLDASPNQIARALFGRRAPAADGARGATARTVNPKRPSGSTL